MNIGEVGWRQLGALITHHIVHTVVPFWTKQSTGKLFFEDLVQRREDWSRGPYNLSRSERLFAGRWRSPQLVRGWKCCLQPLP